MFKEDIPNNMFVLLLIRGDKVIPQPLLDKFYIEKIAEFVNNNIYNRVVLIVRSKSEPHTEEYPPLDLMDTLVEKINKETHIFYQDPWPTEVPNFIEDKDTMFLQLGFNEDFKDLKLKGVQLDNRFIFLSNKEMFKLNKRKNALI
tara:strand:+ start:4076 stop:4510 length:435 start_codon:yes stop_codon:yes gene_type:complete